MVTVVESTTDMSTVPLDVPLGLSEVYTLAAVFITSCPSSNPTLPVKAFPTLNLTMSGTSGTVAYANSSSAANSTYLAFVHRLEYGLCTCG